MLAREVEDEDSGKHLILNHHSWKGFCCCFCRSTNHRFGPTTAMILLCEHPTPVGCESAQSILRPALNRPGAPASCSRCERPLDTACWCVASRRVVWPTCVPLPPWPRPSACGGSDANTPCETWDRNGPPSGPLPPAAFSENGCLAC